MSGYQGPGRYRHYTGGTYDVIGLGQVEATGEHVVIYNPIGSDVASIVVQGVECPVASYTRPLNDFNEVILNPDAQIAQVPRFKRMA